jgi:hypothetical protein
LVHHVAEIRAKEDIEEAGIKAHGFGKLVSMRQNFGAIPVDARLADEEGDILVLSVIDQSCHIGAFQDRLDRAEESVVLREVTDLASADDDVNVSVVAGVEMDR